jgi:hypothetical protein
MSDGSTAFHMLRFVVTEVRRIKSNTGMGFRLGAGWPGPTGADTLFEMEKSKSRAGGTADAAVHPKPTDPTSWEVEVPW